LRPRVRERPRDWERWRDGVRREGERDPVTIDAGRNQRRGRSDPIFHGWSPESQG